MSVLPSSICDNLSLSLGYTVKMNWGKKTIYFSDFSPEVILFFERRFRKQAIRNTLIRSIDAPTTINTPITRREKGFEGKSPSGGDA